MSAISRRRVLLGGLSLGLMVAGGRPVIAASKPTVTVHKSPT